MLLITRQIHENSSPGIPKPSWNLFSSNIKNDFGQEVIFKSISQHGLLSSSGSSQRRIQKSKFCSRNVSASKYFFVNFLLISNDIDLNPGPVYKPKCSACKKCIRRNQREFTCAGCSCKFHLKCVNTDSSDVKNPSRKEKKSNSDAWFCLGCLFPSSDSYLDDSDEDRNIPSNNVPTTEETIELKRLKGITMAHLNTRSLVNKIDELRLFFQGNKIDILTISETWLDGSIEDGEISISGYQMVRKDRNRH